MSEEETSTVPTPSGAAPVLVAVDFTADSEAALIWACGFADVTGAPVKVLHVVHDPGDAPGYYQRKDEDLLRPMEEVAAEMMAAFLQRVGKQHPQLGALAAAESLLVKGLPASRILEAAEQSQAQLIVMGSRGRTGLPHLLLGSKAERVVQLSPVPVTIVKSQHSEDRDG